MNKTEQPACAGCHAPGPSTGHGKRWRLCSRCRATWTKVVPRLDVSLPEEDSDFKTVLRVAVGLKVNVFDALVRECFRQQFLERQASDPEGFEVMTEDARLLHDRFGMVYQYAPGAKPVLRKKLERADRAERKRRAQQGLPPFQGEATKQRQVKYRLSKAKKASP